MNKTNDAARVFREFGIELVGSAVEDRESESLLIFVSTGLDNDGNQKPSNYSISKAEAAAEEELGHVRVIIVRSGNEDIRSSIKSMIIRRYHDEIRNVFSSVEHDSVAVWVEPRYTISKEKSDEIKNETAGLTSHFGVELKSFTNTSALNLPSEKACLSALRLHAPATEADIIRELECRDFEVPDTEWLMRLLDRQRKKKLIYRKKSSGRFVMTLQGLRYLGSGKTRHSPDVRRALVLAQRHE